MNMADISCASIAKLISVKSRVASVADGAQVHGKDEGVRSRLPERSLSSSAHHRESQKPRYWYWLRASFSKRWSNGSQPLGMPILAVPGDVSVEEHAS